VHGKEICPSSTGPGELRLTEMMDDTSEIPEWWRLLEVLTLGRGYRLAKTENGA
jgi:hypothetical protein